jgi:hypothetical protein
MLMKIILKNSITETNQLMVFKEIVAVCSGNYNK